MTERGGRECDMTSVGKHCCIGDMPVAACTFGALMLRTARSFVRSAPHEIPVVRLLHAVRPCTMHTQHLVMHTARQIRKPAAASAANRQGGCTAA